MRTIFAVVLVLACETVAPAAELRYLDADPTGGRSQAVVVEPTALAHTAQLMAVDKSGRILGRGDASVQADKVLDNLAVALRKAGSSLGQIVKLNVYAVQQPAADAARKVLARRFTGTAKPAVTFVIGALPDADAVVSMDAVAVSSRSSAAGPERIHCGNLPEIAGGTHVAILPNGPAIYVSGQSERGRDLAEATRKTMDSLRATLAELHLHDEHIVQLKAFFDPMKNADVVRHEITASFGGHRAPPLVLVHWLAKESVEIEMIVAGDHARSATHDTLTFFTPRGMTASPVYSRVCRIEHGNRIYVGGLYGNGDAGMNQAQSIFAQLDGLLRRTGSDFNHLVKATYYVSTDDAGKQLNELRPKFYDPKRPPAASKATVAGTGMKGRTLMLDMIAVARP